MTRFRVATYNIHKCRGLDWKVNTARIAHVIDEVDADAIALQEVFLAQIEALAKHVEMQYVFGKATEISGKEYGNGILTRCQLGQNRNFDLSVPGREPRKCLRVDLALPGFGELH